MTTQLTPYGVSPLKVRFCPKCFPIPSIGVPKDGIGQHARFQWALQLVCPRCNCLFSICTQCTTQRNQILNSRTLLCHNRDSHQNATVQPHLPVTVQLSSPSTISELPTESLDLDTAFTLGRCGLDVGLRRWT